MGPRVREEDGIFPEWLTSSPRQLSNSFESELATAFFFLPRLGF
jgi:hypothetical protein